MPRPRDISWGFGTSATWDQFLRSDNEEHRKLVSFGALQISFVEGAFEASQGLAVRNVSLSGGCRGLIHTMCSGSFATVTEFLFSGPPPVPVSIVKPQYFLKL